jgi:hypothetical protein
VGEDRKVAKGRESDKNERKKGENAPHEPVRLSATGRRAGKVGLALCAIKWGIFKESVLLRNEGSVGSCHGRREVRDGVTLQSGRTTSRQYKVVRAGERVGEKAARSGDGTREGKRKEENVPCNRQ